MIFTRFFCPPENATQNANSNPTWAHDLKTRVYGGFGLSFIVSHEARELQFFHRRQVQPIQRATMFVARIPVLAQGRLENCRRQSAKQEWVLVLQDGKPRLDLPPLDSRQHPAGPIGFELH